MKKALIVIIIILVLPSAVFAASQEQNYVPANVAVFVNGEQTIFSEEPIIVNHSVLLPLREIAESLGATVKWQQNPDHVALKKDNKELIVLLESKEVLIGRQLFMMEQIPIIVDGRTMVSFRFISEAMGANLTWDEKNRTVNIVDNGNFAKLPQATSDNSANADKYYKLYDILIGGGDGPEYEEAKHYVLKQGLLNEVKDIQRIYDEVDGNITMVSGIDEDGQEMYIWLSKDQYVGDISIEGAALRYSGISQEKVISILQEKGINEASIRKLYIAPYGKEHILWFVFAEQGGKRYYYYLDFITGSVFTESIQ
ncbi:MAG TPA: stalk domain-containing protein [Syntrophomonadaceae bacterium]|nr:stalk domain-containing protein [Syntrophomonadaceae bacterium]